MKKSDLSTIFEWRNHREIRKRMFNQNKIKFDEHQDWFKEASQNPNKVLLINNRRYEILKPKKVMSSSLE